MLSQRWMLVGVLGIHVSGDSCKNEREVTTLVKEGNKTKHQEIPREVQRSSGMDGDEAEITINYSKAPEGYSPKIAAHRASEYQDNSERCNRLIPTTRLFGLIGSEAKGVAPDLATGPRKSVCIAASPRGRLHVTMDCTDERVTTVEEFRTNMQALWEDRVIFEERAGGLLAFPAADREGFEWFSLEFAKPIAQCSFLFQLLSRAHHSSENVERRKPDLVDFASFVVPAPGENFPRREEADELP